MMRIARETVKGSFLVARLLAVLCLLATGASVMASSHGEQSLRSRVEQFYSAVQQGDWPRAEKYLTKDSKPIFRAQSKKPVLGYQIQSIQLAPDEHAASVVVQIPFMSAAAPRPFLVPKTTQWRLINKGWYLEIPKPGPNDQQALLAAAAPQQQVPSPPPLAVSKDLKFESLWCSVGDVYAGQTEVARFPFTNVSTHVVTLSEIQVGCDCLRLKTQQKEFKPGESGALEFEFDPSRLRFRTEESFSQDIILKTEPGGVYVKLTIAALVTPGPAPPAKP